ncbi:LPS-assembly protein LptD [Allofranklinella schreckenbergeri]|uniref:LPS-assembly protein LptD n=1 Tax=Allofranklinella schreckenbergeri TaxID=1076744 RepID=A0A3M6R558_9BURK|nr:LPS-assembly protein LptD [Allofranklinella schreckenbergeri]
MAALGAGAQHNPKQNAFERALRRPLLPNKPGDIFAALPATGRLSKTLRNGHFVNTKGFASIPATPRFVNLCSGVRRRAVSAAALASLAWLAQPLTAYGDEAPARGAAPLQPSALLQEAIPAQQAAKRPIFLSGDSIEGQQTASEADATPADAHIRIQGNARLRRANTLIQADALQYHPASRTATASGHVHIDNAGDVYQGEHLELELDTYAGHFQPVNYRLLRNQAHGQAKRVDFIDRDRYVVHEGDYTTCPRIEHDPDWRPAWQLRARKLTIDRAADVGIVHGAVLDFMGVPILPLPYLDFPLSGQRKSGLLPPTLGLDSTSGLQYAQPYYWNIAPNRDATLTGALMSKRGISLGGQFRYLEPGYSGEVAAQWMPSDRLRDRQRWSAAARHQQALASPVGDVRLELDARRVSDANYWRDFPRSGYNLNERLLRSELGATWQGGRQKDLTVLLRARKWQTLQDVDSVILPPYDMLPQLHVRYTPWEIGAGLDFSLELDSTRFRADKAFAAQLTDGQRSYAQAKLSRPFIAPQGFLTPALQLHASHYRLDSPLAGRQSRSLALPTLSLDSGLVFERPTTLRNRALLQTLEPRAFYTYTPYRDQSMLPMYDSAGLDFTFASIFAPNSFVGHDRIADNHLLTAGLTSRLLDADSGAELLRASFAQRLRFADQRVTAPGVPGQDKGWSDVLLGANVNWSPRWASSGVIQYNYDQRHTARYTLTGHYKPGQYRVLSAGYRMKHNASKQIELGWQWPLNAGSASPAALAANGALRPELARNQGRWYTVGRLNYSLQDKKLVDTVIGLEYSSCCWAGRIVLERLQNSARTANTRVLFQLELAGLSRINIGSNPLASLRTHVPYYEDIHTPVAPPGSRFTQYD